MLISLKTGVVVEIVEENAELQKLLLSIEGKIEKGINYPLLTGRVVKNDKVQANTTAVEIGLGTGGYHFITAILNDGVDKKTSSKGHIMKMRYTPGQIKVLSVEEPESPYHQLIKDFRSLYDKPVIVGFLHSMLLPCVAGIRAINPKLKISYVMTDGGALPLALSNNVKTLKELKWIQGTVTTGHAFGGDLEAINVYSGIAAASVVQNADIIVVAMGPGIVGTGTELGTTALEVGQIINAIGSLDGKPIVIPRINFEDLRKRHNGISHHTTTVLKKIALTSCTLVLPKLKDLNRSELLKNQLDKEQIQKKHRVVFQDGNDGLDLLKRESILVETMGRSIKEEEEFFLTTCAAGSYAAMLI